MEFDKGVLKITCKICLEKAKQELVSTFYDLSFFVGERPESGTPSGSFFFPDDPSPPSPALKKQSPFKQVNSCVSSMTIIGFNDHRSIPIFPFPFPKSIFS